MRDPAEILDYLPLYPGSLSEYIQHLWKVFSLLAIEQEESHAFSVLPFHLLFMLSLQYKVLRISFYHNAEYCEYIRRHAGLRAPSTIQQLVNNAPVDRASRMSSDVRSLSLIPEKRLSRCLEIAGLTPSTNKRICDLVELRNQYAHANGNIESDLNGRIDEYLELLDEVQTHFVAINDIVYDDLIVNGYPWDGDKDELELQFSAEHICFADLRMGKLSSLDF